MPKRRQVAVLGLGRFGQTVARELSQLGHDVLAIDRDEKTVQAIADDVTYAVQADITDEEALDRLGLRDVDVAIVGVSESLEASILATVLLRRLGVSAIIAKVAHDLHAEILLQVGATRVVFPERESGLRVAHSYAAAGVRDYLDAGPEYGFARIDVPPAWIGKTLGELDLQASCALTPVAVARAGTLVLNPGPSERLNAGESLIVAGLDDDLEHLPADTRPAR